jgi:hypothetical protein
MKVGMHTRTFRIYILYTYEYIYILLTTFPRQQWLRGRSSLLRYTYLSGDVICDSEPLGARCHCYRNASVRYWHTGLLFWFMLVTCTEHGGLWNSAADCPDWLVEIIFLGGEANCRLAAPDVLNVCALISTNWPQCYLFDGANPVFLQGRKWNVFHFPAIF